MAAAAAAAAYIRVVGVDVLEGLEHVLKFGLDGAVGSLLEIARLALDALLRVEDSRRLAETVGGDHSKLARPGIDLLRRRQRVGGPTGRGHLRTRR